jgi:hypothetical protein
MNVKRVRKADPENHSNSTRFDPRLNLFEAHFLGMNPLTLLFS